MVIVGFQVAAFTLSNTATNGSYDLTSQLNTASEASGGANQEYDMYTVSIPAAAYPELLLGTATFSLALQGAGITVLGASDFNGAGLDFSTLTLTNVPEPSSLAASLLAGGVAAGACLRRRVRRG